MRPQALFPLFAQIDRLPGVGQRTQALIAKLAGDRVVDLLWHTPTGVIDRREAPALSAVVPGAVTTLLLEVLEHRPGGAPRSPHRIVCRDAEGAELDIVYFQAKADWLWKTYPPRDRVAVSGRVEQYRDRLQMVHPDEVGPPDQADTIARIEPVYPLTAGLTGKTLGRALQAVLADLPALPEWMDPALKDRMAWPDWANAVRDVHAPQTTEDLAAANPARARLAYDELLANQIALAVVRAKLRRRRGRSTPSVGTLRSRIVESLPFTLTAGQSQALADIDADMAADHRMVRLLQGDVGSGKTVVALLAMASAVEHGRQAALLAPTEILARQHLATLVPLAAKAGMAIDILTGRDSGARRAAVLLGLADGTLPLVVGTHALLQADVRFQDLALVVIDEQHRFGVDQRLALTEKGRGVDILAMTATPIPRTLQMSAYGDMDVSAIPDKPPGRAPVDTRAVPMDRLEEVVDGLARHLETGRKAFWVCPRVEDTGTDGPDAIRLTDATSRHAALVARFGDRIGLVHGRMPGAEKDAVMTAFADGPVDVLVATTVVEVGVNVPDATLMVIEHAERFGLAQLHQLRGRVGRGGGKSVCVLLYQPPVGPSMHTRLTTIRNTDDGFAIAEADLALRGAGDMLGIRQSGLPDFRMAVLPAHQDLLAIAHDDARVLLAADPNLDTPRGEAVRTLLYLWDRDSAIRYLQSG